MLTPNEAIKMVQDSGLKIKTGFKLGNEYIFCHEGIANNPYIAINYNNSKVRVCSPTENPVGYANAYKNNRIV